MDNVETIENNEQDENPIKDLIKASLDKDYNHANKIFGEVMTIKMSDLLDQEKVKLADQIYNQVPEDEVTDDVIDDEADAEDEDIEDEALEGDDESDEVEESEEDIDDDEDEDESDDDEYDEVEGAAV
tara:strand:+ start:564 stop:947 length:384 start_codon:yes stop_codon:yes gene_type:complete